MAVPTLLPPVPAPLASQVKATAVTAEVPRRASLRLRIAHVVLFRTVRAFFVGGLWAVDHHLLGRRRVLLLARLLDAVLTPLRPPRGTQLRRIAFPEFDAEWVWPQGVDDPEYDRSSAILYLHGGGLVACGLNSHRRLVARIATASGAPLLNVNYRQIPQVHVTDTVRDCVTAYKYLLDQGFPAETIVLAGDSAGGGLAFAVALAAREASLPMPGGIAALSPWADYDSTARFAHPNARTDAVLTARAYSMPATWGMMRSGFLNPTWSPVNHQFDGLPPVLIQVASTEVVLSDAEQLAARCVEAGVPLTFQIWDNAFHVFQAAADCIPDARDAIAVIGRFIHERIADATVPTSAYRTPA